jgi:hypothetical protein
MYGCNSGTEQPTLYALGKAPETGNRSRHMSSGHLYFEHTSGKGSITQFLLATDSRGAIDVDQRYSDHVAADLTFEIVEDVVVQTKLQTSSNQRISCKYWLCLQPAVAHIS